MAKPVLIEVAIETVADAVAATAGGADRLELCSALDFGGLTPSIGMFLEVRAATSLPVCVVIRPRPGHFVTSASEHRVMCRDIDLFRDHSPAGFVFGVLRSDGRIAVDKCVELIFRAADRPCVFHRAFDKTPDRFEALERLVSLGFRRVLSSGGEPQALSGVRALKGMIAQAKQRIEVLPCGGIRAAQVVNVVRETGCDQIHGSFGVPVPEGKSRGTRGYSSRSETSRAEVAATRTALEAADVRL